jgi:hypothetical protein
MTAEVPPASKMKEKFLSGGNQTLIWSKVFSGKCTQFHAVTPSGSRVMPCGRTGGTNMTKLAVAVANFLFFFAKALKNE